MLNERQSKHYNCRKDANQHDEIKHELGTCFICLPVHVE